jgi:hypothetical protein
MRYRKVLTNFSSLLNLLMAGLLMKFQQNAKSIRHKYKDTCIKSMIMQAVGLQRNMLKDLWDTLLVSHIIWLRIVGRLVTNELERIDRGPIEVLS